tara:strand:- start:64536 stop:65741 length:1206 start_codon:yes stop_codon:yes gene_type:complete
VSDLEREALKRNPGKLYLFSFLWMFMIIMPIIVLFFKDRGLPLTDIYWLQSVFAATMIVCELPSGYICDLFGRKGALIIASVFHGIGFSIFPFTSDFATLVVAEIFLGVGVSLFSGTDTSLIYDTMNAIDPKKAKIKLIGRLMFYRQIGEFAGALVGGWIVYWSLEANVVSNAIVSWLPLIVALSLVEPKREKLSKTKHIDNFKYIFKSLFGHSSLLNLLFLNFIFYSVATITAIWSYQGRWEEVGIPLEYFGYLWAFNSLIVAFMGKNAHKIEKRLGSSGALIYYGMVPAIGFLGLSYFSNIFLVVGLCYFLQSGRAINAVVIRDGINKRVSGDMRATANSLAGAGMRLVFGVIGPVFGYVVDNGSYQKAYLWMGWIYVVCFFLVLLPLLFQRKNFDPIN